MTAAPSLDPSLYSNITPDDLAFFRQATATTDDDDAVKDHILNVQAKAYHVYSYPCIRRFAFIRPKIASLPAYHHALRLLNTRTDPILLDIGCCCMYFVFFCAIYSWFAVGNDIRKAALDGWPANNIVASDLRSEFWDIGHQLFKSNPQSFPATFIQGDVFDDAFLSTDAPHSSVPVNTITTLTPLVHRVSAIHTSSLFHLFSEDQQLLLARRLSTLLIPEAGSIIFGQHGSRPVKGFRYEAPHRDSSEKFKHAYMFCHSPESWKKLWTEDIFGPDQRIRVKVDAELMEVERKDLKYAAILEDRFWVMSWSVQIL